MIVNKKAIQHRQGKEKKYERHVSLPSIQSKSKQKHPGRKAIVPIGKTAPPPQLASTADETIAAIAKRLLQSPRQEGNTSGSVHVKFNHYNTAFPIHNGVLKWIDIDEAYCFSFVYRGMYRREIICVSEIATDDHKKYMRRDINGEYFIDLQINCNYEVEIEEDPIAGVGAEGLRVNDKPIFTSSPESESIRSGNRATKILTDELRRMSPDKLGSEEAKDILARRDIEDVLFT